MYSNGTWRVDIRSKARKALRKIPAKDVGALIVAIEELTQNPYVGDIEKLWGETGAWRRRVGAYRIKFEVHQATHSVYVYEIKRRGSNTY